MYYEAKGTRGRKESERRTIKKNKRVYRVLKSNREEEAY